LKWKEVKDKKTPGPTFVVAAVGHKLKETDWKEKGWELIQFN